jgi:hypothetical protein
LPVSSGSCLGDLVQTDIGENSQLDTGLSGYWTGPAHLVLERDGVENFIESFEVGRENTATRQLHL